MNKNKHLLLWSSLGALALLVTAAVQENILKDWRRMQQSAKAESGPLDVHLRQIVIPGLKVADRCTTCHVGMAPGEQGISGPRLAQAHPRLPHEPADLGCTVCHGGQGLATEKADAHGDVHFWPQPMIPLRFVQAGCGSCHTPTGVPEQEQLAQGRNLIERYDCLLCHRLDDRGGTVRPDGAGVEGPNLSAVGVTGWNQHWYEEHLLKSQAQGGPWSGAFGAIAVSEVAAINGFLATRVSAPRLVEAKALFHSRGCQGCHKVNGVGGDEGPDLTHAGEKDPGRLDFAHVPGPPTVANWHAEHLRRPAAVVAGSQMPATDLTADEIDLLTLYMLSLRRGDYPGSYWPKDRVRSERLGEREFAADGATLYGTFCSGCHGRQGDGARYPGLTAAPAIGNPDFLAVASDEFLAEAIRQGRPGRRMPAWGDAASGLRPEENTAVIAHLRRLGHMPAPAVDARPARWAKGDSVEGGRLYATYCQGCHGDKGQGLEGTALSNKTLLATATDTYFFETISRGRSGTPMSAFAQPSPVHPALTAPEIESLVSFIRTWEQP